MKQSEVIFDLAKKDRAIKELEDRSADPNLWDDPQTAQKLMQDMNRLKEEIEPWRVLKRKIEDLEVLVELVDESGTEEDAREVEQEISRLKEEFDRLELSTLFSGEHDSSSAIMEINAGAGGTEACDWVDILTRMYLRWAERHSYKTEIMNQVLGDTAGTKNVTFLVEGRNAYGYLKAERGVHRLVRISPFDANHRRHTSFASVDVIPEIEEASEVNINPDDLRIDTFRASSAGGQHVNKTDSAVRITHIPTGIVVSCQNERSQHKNKDVAMKILVSRLAELERAESEARMAQLRGDLSKIEWGSQIRSYVFQPYTLVKDVRTGHETGDVLRVMDGDLDDFIQAYLRSNGRESS